MRQFFYFGAICSVLALFASPYSSQAFSDIGSSPFSESITSLAEQGVLEGYSDGTFRPANTINRAEFLKIVLEGRGGDTTYTAGNCFPDVQEEDWFSKYVCTASAEGIVEGYPDGTFKPGQLINFVEASKIITLAYKQETSGGYYDNWFTEFVKALEGSKAIPVSIDAFDKQLTRGEMVEMMWRLAEEKTDQPSVGYLNIKHPDLSVNMAEDTVQIAQSCEDVRTLIQEADTQNFGHMGVFMEMEESMPVMMMDGDSAPTGAVASPRAKSQGTDDYSDTNVQVQGVDEADIVKTDGTYLYIIRDQNVYIVRAQPSTDLKVLAALDYADHNFYPSELYVQEDGRFIVLGSSWEEYQIQPTVLERIGLVDSYYPYHTTNKTEVKIYDFVESTGIKKVRELSFEGNQVSTRRIDNNLYLVLNQGLYWNRPIPLAETDNSDLLPMMRDNVTERPVVTCGEIAILPRIPNPQYLITAVIPTDSADGKVSTSVIIGNGENIYASKDNLYVANTEWNYRWKAGGSSQTEKTNIYRFSLKNDGIEFMSQGSVPGHVLNQFSMDEYERTFRIATTTNQEWNTGEPMKNHLYVLDMDLDTIGSITDIAPGEKIYSVRFMGDRTYMVTFKTIDPLFVIDTSNPQNPTILGQLKIPGFSDYLHPYDEDHIIGFGKDTEESKDGTVAWVQGVKIAVFDVSDVKNPTEKHRLILGDRGSDSPLLQNYKALLFERDRNLLAFPISIAKVPDSQKNQGTSAWGQTVFQGAHVYKLTMDRGFELQGAISHYTEEDITKMGSYFYGKNVERILRIGEALYTISEAGIQSHNVTSIEQEGATSYKQQELLNGCPIDKSFAVFVSKDPEMCKLMDFACAEGQEAFDGECGCGCY